MIQKLKLLYTTRDNFVPVTPDGFNNIENSLLMLRADEDAVWNFIIAALSPPVCRYVAHFLTHTWEEDAQQDSQFVVYGKLQVWMNIIVDSLS